MFVPLAKPENLCGLQQQLQPGSLKRSPEEVVQNIPNIATDTSSLLGESEASDAKSRLENAALGTFPSHKLHNATGPMPQDVLLGISNDVLEVTWK